MKTLFLLSTKHLEDCLWFREEDDFRVAMNYIAIEAARHPEVIVLAFILLSNHSHFVLWGRRQDVIDFVNDFKQRYAVYYRKKYGVIGLLRRNGLDVKEIPMDNEAPERAIAYVLVNSVAANICAFSNQYEWGTGNLCFNPERMKGVLLDSLSQRARERLLHSNADDIPGHWIVGENGYILPGNYVDIQSVEKLFRTVNRMNYFLNSSSKAKKRIEAAGDKLPAFRDQIILAALPDLYRTLFQKKSFDDLSSEEQTEFLRQVRFRFSADVKQLARVCGLTQAQVAELLDAV